MSDVHLDVVQVETTRKMLNEKAPDIAKDLAGLLSKVTTMLGESGGLWMDQGSPKMQEQYVQFTSSLQSAIQNIPVFANSFNDIATALQNMNLSLADPGQSES